MPCCTLFDHAIAEGFVHSDHRRLIVSAAQPDDLLEALDAYQGASSILKLMGSSRPNRR